MVEHPSDWSPEWLNGTDIYINMDIVIYVGMVCLSHYITKIQGLIVALP